MDPVNTHIPCINCGKLIPFDPGCKAIQEHQQECKKKSKAKKDKPAIQKMLSMKVNDEIDVNAVNDHIERFQAK